jgi:chemosensory pili system protein ChpB (putative protein-glutamate methylesterase)
MSNIKPRVGVISDALLQRHVLQDMMKNYGIDVTAQLGPERADYNLLSSNDFDAWIVDISQEEAWGNTLEKVLDSVKAPLLFCDGQAPIKNSAAYPQWERRIYSKLKDLLSLEALAETSESLETVTKQEQVKEIPLPPEIERVQINVDQPVERVYLLIASLGGPAAVKQFLDSLPAGLPVAFIYAQHIDQKCQHLLPQVLGRHSHYKLAMAEQNRVLHYGDVLITPVESEMTLNADGVVEVKDVPWEGPYSPSFDQIINNLSVVYEDKVRAIIFSGMGNDGAIAGVHMVRRGGKVWAQTADTCACSSMPDALRETGCVSFSGTPQQLALHLVQTLQSELRANAA